MGRSYYDCFGKNAKEWLNDKKLPKGMSEHNVVYLREYKDLLDEYKKYTVMLYFMLSVMKIEYARRMFYSCKRSKEYIIAMVLNMKEKRITNKYVKHFENDVMRARDRLETIDKIIKEDLFLTEYYPYFMEKGFDILKDFENDGSGKEQLQVIVDDFEHWKIDNKEKLDAHIVEMQKKNDIYLEYKKKIDAQKKAEKEAIKLAKKAANDEVKEIRENNKKHKSEYRKLERSFERYYNSKI